MTCSIGVLCSGPGVDLDSVDESLVDEVIVALQRATADATLRDGKRASLLARRTNP